MSDMLHVLGSNIVKERKKKKLTQVQLSCKIGKANTFLCDIEKGRSTPALNTLWKIADALEIEASELLRRDIDV